MDVRVAGRPAGDRVRFEGQQGPWFKAQLGRLALTIFTLGLHRFWWKTAIRRWLWAETTIDGDPLDYRGRGIELLLGAMLVFLLLLVPLSALMLGLGVLRGLDLGWLALAAQGALMPGLLWLFGFGVYRSRRYLLSRTSWRGIRAGMAGDGLAYAWLNLRLVLLNLVTLGFATPYADTQRWNALWGAAMYGNLQVRADVDWRTLTGSFWPAYLGSILAFGLAFAMGWEGMEILWRVLSGAGSGAILDIGANFALVETGGYLIIALAASVFLMLGYRAHFHQEALGATSVGGMRFGFSATAGDWLRFYAGNLGWAVLTLGVGLLLLRFRLWHFWMDHLLLYGELDSRNVRQSLLSVPLQGDGLADAFAIGRI